MNFKQIIALVSLCTLTHAQAGSNVVKLAQVVKTLAATPTAKGVGITAAALVGLYSLPIASKATSLTINQCFKALSAASIRIYDCLGMSEMSDFVQDYQENLWDRMLEKDEEASLIFGFYTLMIGGSIVLATHLAQA